MRSPAECQRLIQEGMKRAVEGRKEMKPYRLTHPVKLEVTFKNIVDAELASYLPGVERPRGSTIVFQARDMIEASKFLEAVLGMNAFRVMPLTAKRNDELEQTAKPASERIHEERKTKSPCNRARDTPVLFPGGPSSRVSAGLSSILREPVGGTNRLRR